MSVTPTTQIMTSEEILIEFDNYVFRCLERKAWGYDILFNITTLDLTDTYTPDRNESPDENTEYRFLIRWLIRFCTEVFEQDYSAARDWFVGPVHALNGEVPVQLAQSHDGALSVFRALDRLHTECRS